MTREEAIEVLKDIYNYTRFDTYTTNEARTMAIKALEQEPCDDCVSRQAVIELLNKRYCHKEPYERKEGNTVYKGYDTYYMINFDKLKALPSVLPKREQGEWCEQNDDYFDWYECSECGYGSEGEMQYSSEHDVRTKYCPNCGAEMVIKSCSTCKHDGELVCATHGCHNKERYEVEE